MQNSTRNTLVRVVSPVLLGTLALTGCAMDSRSPTEVVAAAPALSGEQIFRGVFFGQGPAAALLPELWKGKSVEERAQTPERVARVRALQNEVVAQIADKDPAFFERFGATVRAGNHVAVERALQDAARLLRDELLASPTYGAIRTSEEVADPVVDIEIAVYAVLVVVVFWIDFNVVAENTAMSVDGLQRDQLVDMMVKRMAS